MRRALLVTAAAICAVAALPAAAQDARSGGLRYLSWSNRPAPVEPAPAAGAEPAGPAWRVAEGQLRRPARVIPHGGFAPIASAPRGGLTPAPGSAGDRLTPADAWVAPDSVNMASPSRAPAYRAQPAFGQRRAPSGEASYYAEHIARPASEAAMPEYAADRASAAPAPAPSPAPPPVQPQPVYAESPTAPRPGAAPASSPVPGPVYGQPDYTAVPTYTAAPAPVAAPAASAPAPVVDPMAPRRDAPIFSIRRGAPAPETASPAVATDTGRPYPASTAASGQPTPQRARYYSVHRQNGQEPDPATMPQSGYIDGLAVNLPESLASEDLSRPPEPPAMIRDRNGNMRAAPAASDGDHQ